MRIELTSKDLKALNNIPQKMNIQDSYWLLHPDREGRRMIAELWIENPEGDTQGVYRGIDKFVGVLSDLSRGVVR